MLTFYIKTRVSSVDFFRETAGDGY